MSVCWVQFLSQALSRSELGFPTLQPWSDNSMFLLFGQSSTLIVQVYVDDILITGSSKAQIADLIAKLNSTFALRDLGLLTYFLGIELHHHGLFREDLAGIYTAEIVSAASHLYANEIMHRDLKPDNIILDVDGHAMFADFGFAKQFAGDTRSKTMCGRIEYMSPQVFLGKGYVKATDWWGVGSMLFEMLTGHLPIICSNRQKIQQKIIIEKAKLPAFLQGKHIPS
ncbi:hypothetical protein HHK36_031877 [Tetracentron sinense]|uniref:Protein kinase domain-containing protein n=1 Tax=Tetracentron sinense TaxID=13715 RepID=A0A834Y890_TETSI|nr:hypothetical protein HHK36_031877 [Tetracentron sinense]